MLAASFRAQQAAVRLKAKALARTIHSDILRAIPHLRVFAISLTGNVDEADDLVQEAVVRALANLDQFTPGTSMQGWLFTILRNHHFTVYRKRRREIQDPEGLFAGRLATAPAQSDYIDLDDLWAALLMLPDEQREALLLIASGFTYEEAAQVCGTASGTIKSRVNRARRHLADLLEIMEPGGYRSGSRDEGHLTQHMRSRRSNIIGTCLGDTLCADMAT
ncbi:sigma-70 family RNA polymerase sigma factor [Microvirga massiliensis]|uniref:sigma-70 family RNA polymerase sigma factor n=1 Tax=Microvirga massiliensis TaxID=1033741 RepID=UPI000A73119C|nr:sigma-70 family RNA polymerase sigma factor [Microvirga massiliensis]